MNELFAQSFSRTLMPIEGGRCGEYVQVNLQIFKYSPFILLSLSNLGGKFSFVQRKVDVPIFNRGRCENRMKQELSNRFR